MDDLRLGKRRIGWGRDGDSNIDEVAVIYLL
jgi:hypothetical protein